MIAQKKSGVCVGRRTVESQKFRKGEDDCGRKAGAANRGPVVARAATVQPAQLIEDKGRERQDDERRISALHKRRAVRPWTGRLS